MEPCFGTPNYLIEKYMPSDQDETGCMARLEYIVKSDWTGFCLQLQGADLDKYSKITFDIRADDPVPAMMKIDLRRDNGQEVSSAKVSGITQQWKTMSVDLSAFQAVGWASPLSSLTNLEELALVFEEGRSGESGVVYIDNIQAVP
jgi:hypothetical protein